VFGFLASFAAAPYVTMFLIYGEYIPYHYETVVFLGSTLFFILFSLLPSRKRRPVEINIIPSIGFEARHKARQGRGLKPYTDARGNLTLIAILENGDSHPNLDDISEKKRNEIQDGIDSGAILIDRHPCSTLTEINRIYLKKASFLEDITKQMILEKEQVRLHDCERQKNLVKRKSVIRFISIIAGAILGLSIPFDYWKLFHLFFGN